MPPTSACCCVPWTVGRLRARARHNTGRPIKFQSPETALAVKSPHKGYSCVVSVTRGKEMPASACSSTHTGSSVSAGHKSALTGVRPSSLGLSDARWRLGVYGRCFIRTRVKGEAWGCWRAKHTPARSWLHTYTRSFTGFVSGFVLATHGWRHILCSPPV